jgi:hypothetical protein
LRGISEPRFMVLSQIDHFMGKWWYWNHLDF